MPSLPKESHFLKRMKAMSQKIPPLLWFTLPLQDSSHLSDIPRSFMTVCVSGEGQRARGPMGAPFYFAQRVPEKLPLLTVPGF